MDNKTFLQQLESNFESIDELDDLNDVLEDDMLGSGDTSYVLPKGQRSLDTLHGDIVEMPDADDLDDYDPGITFGNTESQSLLADSDDLDNIDDLDGLDDIDDLDDLGNSPNGLDDISALDDLTVDLSFDIESLDADYKPSAVKPEDQDEALLKQQLKSACLELGYAVPQSTSLETMKMMHDYAVACQEPADFHTVYTRYYSQMLMQLAASSSLHVPQQTSIVQYKAKLLKCVQDPLLQDACAMAVNMIYDQISRLKQKTLDTINIRIEDLDLNGIYRGLMESPRLVTTYIATQETKVRNFISTAAGILIENEISDESAIRNDSSRRDSLSRTLTAEAYSATVAITSKDFAYIKSISSSNGGDIICTCAKCGKKTKITSLMRFIFFSSGKDLIKYVYPTINECECGCVLLFPMQLYAKAITHYESEYHAGLTSAVEKAKDFSSGTAVLSVTPALSQLPPEIQCIVTDSEVASAEGEESVVEVFHQEEWDKAVKQFYKHLELLEGFEETKRESDKKSTEFRTKITDDSSKENANADTNPSDDADVVTYSIRKPKITTESSRFLSLVAANVAQIAGTDYNTLKGKALVSLITYLNNNSILRANLDFDHVISARAVLRFIENYKNNPQADINRMEPAVFNYLMEITGYISQDFKIVKDKNEVKDFLAQHASELQERADRINREYCEFFEDLFVSKYALSCLPITDYQQTSIYSVIQFISDDEIFQIVDEICDRMIINSYSTKYFNYWCRLSMPHASSLQRRLLTSADLSAIQRTIEAVLGFALPEYGIAVSDKYTANVITQSLDIWEHLKRLVDIAESGNYYRFCSAAISLESEQYGFGKAFDEAIEDFRFLNHEEMSNVVKVTEAEYYLGSMFTREELEEGKECIENIIFGRYLPVRVNNETLEAYAARFRETDIYKCTDNLERFKRLRHLNQTDFSLLCDLFENVFSVTDNDTLADLTYMAYLSKARAFDVSEYINSQYNSISIVTDSYSDDTDNADVSAGADAEMDSDNNKPPEKEVPKAITSRKQKPRKLEKDESEDLLKVHRHKSPLPIALALAGALAANGYFYYAQSQVTKQRKNAEEEFQQLLQSVSTLQSKYTVLSAQSTAEAGAAAYSLLEAVGLTTSRKDITLHSFTINGSTVYITVSAESEDLFWNFYNEISEAYNVSGVADGTLPDDTATYTISMVL